MYRLSLVFCLFALGLSGLAREPEETIAPKKQQEHAEKPAIPQSLAKPMAMEPTVQILFNNPEGAKIYWDATKPGTFDSSGLSIPGRQSFLANAIYRLRVTDISGHKGDEFFPTLEIAPIARLAKKFLADNAIPVQFTPDDLNYARRGIAVTKVVYLPDEEFAELALDGVDTLVSFLLDPGVDPITEADRRGAILAVVRLHDMKLAATPPEAVVESRMPEAVRTAELTNSSARTLRRWFARSGRVAGENRRGWLRRR